MRIALFFGSFNPIHLGHQYLAEYLIQKELTDEVWLVVSPCNPLKKQADLIDKYQRLDMVILATRDNKAIKASDIEFCLPIPSFTIDTLKVFTQQFSQYRFSLMIGSDNALVFNKWKNYKEIMENYAILVYPRPGYDFSQVKSLYSQMICVDSPTYDISSTEIRRNIATQIDSSNWLHPSVYQYIIENKLYQ